MVTASAAQVLQYLNYKIPRVKPVVVTDAKSKEEAEAKTDKEQKQKVELDEDGFKIPQETAHHNKKKLEAEEHRKIVERVLPREFDPSGYLVDIVTVRHELSPSGLSDKEWRCYLLHLASTGHKNATLPQIARSWSLISLK